MSETPTKQQSVRLTAAVNRVLWPRLHALGFRLQFAADGAKWKGGAAIVRTSPSGRRQGLLMGRHKFGGRFGISVARERLDGTWEYLDLATVGIPYSELTYSNQAEAEAMLRRLAEAIEAKAMAWLDEEPFVGA